MFNHLVGLAHLFHEVEGVVGRAVPRVDHPAGHDARGLRRGVGHEKRRESNEKER